MNGQYHKHEKLKVRGAALIILKCGLCLFICLFICLFTSSKLCDTHCSSYIGFVTSKYHGHVGKRGNDISETLHKIVATPAKINDENRLVEIISSDHSETGPWGRRREALFVYQVYGFFSGECGYL